jgi:hypothetical protein
MREERKETEYERGKKGDSDYEKRNNGDQI